MKMNKKLIVPFLSSVIGLSVAGGLGGAFAWYQFNSQVTTSFVGTSVAEGGLLQIGHMEDTTMVWGRDYAKPNIDLLPVTFGALGKRASDNKENSLKTSKPYGRPEAGKQAGNDYTKGWEVMESGYYQYDIYLRALEADASAPGVPAQGIAPGYKAVVKPVFLSDIVINAPTEAPTTDGGKHISDAVRVHLDVEGTTTPNRLISKTKIENMELYGELDLDGVGGLDTYTGYTWETPSTDPIIYGINGEKQTTAGITDVVQARDASGNMPDSPITNPNAKCICYTKDGTDGYTTKITVTVWLEGWQLLNNDPEDHTEQGKVWNPILNAGLQIQVGMTFDAGRNLG